MVNFGTCNYIGYRARPHLDYLKNMPTGISVSQHHVRVKANEHHKQFEDITTHKAHKPYP
jgi:hypothetical protein